MAKTVARTAKQIKVDYSDVTMWAVPHLRQARQNLPGRAPERKTITAVIASLVAKENSALRRRDTDPSI